MAILKDAATVRKKARILPSFQHEQAQNPWPQLGSGSNRCDRRALGTLPPNISVRCNNEGLTPSQTRNSSAPAAQKAPRAVLAPSETLSCSSQQALTESSLRSVHGKRSFLGQAGLICSLFASRMPEMKGCTQDSRCRTLSSLHHVHETRWSEPLCYLVWLCCFAFPSSNL